MTRYFADGPGNQHDRARFALLTEPERHRASNIARLLYDGSRTVARCWSEALDRDLNVSARGLTDELSHVIMDAHWTGRIIDTIFHVTEPSASSPDGLTHQLRVAFTDGSVYCITIEEDS